MTQTDLAKKLGYADKSMIAKIESGTVDLKRTKIIQFAEALGVTPSWLMGWEGPEDVPLAAPQSLSGSEDLLLQVYRKLNTEGQEKVIEYAEDLESSGRYKKGDLPEMGKEA